MTSKITYNEKLETKKAHTKQKADRTRAIKEGRYVDYYSLDTDQLYSDFIELEGQDYMINSENLEMIPVPSMIHPELELINNNVPF